MLIDEVDKAQQLVLVNLHVASRGGRKPQGAWKTQHTVSRFFESARFSLVLFNQIKSNLFVFRRYLIEMSLFHSTAERKT